MPTIKPRVDNTKNGLVSQFSINANDPELRELFARGDLAEFGVNGNIEDNIPDVETGDITEILKGSFNVSIGGLNLGETMIGGGGDTLTASNSDSLGETVENLIRDRFSNDERERILGDWSYNADQVNDLLDAARITFTRNTESKQDKKPRFETKPVDLGDDKGGSMQSMGLKSGGLVLAAGALIAVFVLGGDN